MVGILTALSAVALVQYGKYKRDAGQEVASAQSQFESENCIGVPDRKQCLCDKGLGEALGLDSEDCCPLGQTKDSNGNCVARVAQASSTAPSAQTTDPPPNNPSNSNHCDPFSDSHTYLANGGTPSSCTCPEGREWKLMTYNTHDGQDRYACKCTSYQQDDPDKPCFNCVIPKPLYNTHTKKCVGGAFNYYRCPDSLTIGNAEDRIKRGYGTYDGTCS